MYILFAVPLAPEAIMPQRLKNAPAIDRAVHLPDRQHTTELIAAYPYNTRDSGQFLSQTQDLEDTVHALLHIGIHADRAPPLALGLTGPLVGGIQPHLATQATHG